MALTWHINIDWNNDRTYEADEARYLLGIPRIERGQDSPFDDPIIGTAELQFRNESRRYDGWYTGSSFYPKLPVNCRIQIQVEMNGTTYTLFTGRTSQPRSTGFKAAGASGGQRQMYLTCKDSWKFIQQARANIALMQNTNQKTAISTLLNAIAFTDSENAWLLGTGVLGISTVLAGIVGDNTDLGDDDGDSIPYYWLFNDESASENLNTLVRSHFGRIHILGDGTLKWRTIGADQGTSADLTLTDSMLQEMTVVYSSDLVRNKIALTPNPRKLSALGAVWTLDEIAELGYNESRTFWAEFSNSVGEHVPAINVVSPVATTDFTANSASDGSGTNLTSSITVTATVYSTNVKLVVTNASTTTAYITLLQVRGQAVDSVESQEIVEEDVASQQQYGLQEYNFDMRWQADSQIVDGLGKFMIDAYSQPTPIVECRFQNSATALSYDLGTKIYDATSQGTGLYYRLAKIAHEIPDGNNCQVIYTTWTLFPIMPDDYWVLGVSVLGVSTKLGV